MWLVATGGGPNPIPLSVFPASPTTSTDRCMSQRLGRYTRARSLLLTAGNNAGTNDQLYSFHPGGVNVLFGDGSVHFIKDTVNIVTLRSLVTLKGGEVISADAY